MSSPRSALVGRLRPCSSSGSVVNAIDVCARLLIRKQSRTRGERERGPKEEDTLKFGHGKHRMRRRWKERKTINLLCWLVVSRHTACVCVCAEYIPRKQSTKCETKL